MQWVKIIVTAVVVLCLFAGGIAFDIFVVQKFTNKNTIVAESKQEEQTEITQNIEASTKVKPSLLKMHIGITSSNMLFNTQSLTEAQRDGITKQLDSILQLSQNYKSICKYKPYIFEPRLSYIPDNVGKNTQIGGYNVNFNMDCQMQEADYKSYEDFISQVKKIVYKDGWLDFRIEAFDLALTESMQKEQGQILRELAIKNANELTAEYSKNLGAKCSLVAISFGQNIIPRSILSTLDSTANATYTNIMPEKLDVKTLMENARDLPVSLNANLRIVCTR